MRRYLTRKLITYVLAFFVGATIDWGIPHLMPGNPVQLYLSKFQLQPGGYAALYKTMSEAFGTSLPLWDQYLHFWSGLVRGDLGVSIYEFPSRVTTLVLDAIPYTLALLSAVPSTRPPSRRRGPCSPPGTFSRPSPTRGWPWRSRTCWVRSGTCSRSPGPMTRPCCPP